MEYLEQIYKEYPKDNKMIKEQIEIFSRFLSLTDDDYKYNSTFLGEYISDFFEFKKFVKLKMDLFDQLQSIINIQCDYIFTLDNSYRITKLQSNKKKISFLDVNINEIQSNIVHVHFIKKINNKNSLFYREYSIKKDIQKTIIDDINKFII